MLEPIDTKFLYREVQRRMKDHIIARSLHPGDRLPPEGEITRMLGVSRNVVREALKALEAVGVVEIRKGAGIYVAQFDAAKYVEQYAYSLIVDGIGSKEMWGVRRALELAFIGEAAQRIGQRDLEELDGLIQEMKDEIEAGGSAKLPGLRIHQVAYRCLENSVLQGLLDTFAEYWTRVYEEVLGAETPEVRSMDLERHQRLVDALHHHDGEAAKAALDEELSDIPSWMEQSHSPSRS